MEYIKVSLRWGLSYMNTISRAYDINSKIGIGMIPMVTSIINVNRAANLTRE